MGSVIQDSFYAPHELCVEIQSFLADHERLYSRQSYSEIGVVYSVESEFLRPSGKNLFADNTQNLSTSEVGPFWQVCEALSHAAQPYDVIFFPDGELRPDSLSLQDLIQYRTLILPDCRYLTSAQAGLLVDYLAAGGRLVILGDAGSNLPDETTRRFTSHANTARFESWDGANLGGLPNGPQLILEPASDLAIHIQRLVDGAAVHILRYDYDPLQDCVPPLPALDLQVRLPEIYPNLEVYAPGLLPAAELETAGQVHHITLRDVPLYCVIQLKK
jgi:hypothetical protein